MDPTGRIVLEFIILFILLVLSAFFSSAETAFVSVNQIRMRSLSDDGNKKATLVLKITNNKSKMLSAILIGNNIVNLYASALTTTVTYHLGWEAWASVATGILTFVLLILGEITPKTIATAKAEKISMAYCHMIWGLMVILTPIIFIVNTIAHGILWVFGFRKQEEETTYTEDEIRTIVDVSHEEGVIEEDEHELINNVFELGDSQAKDVMIPRGDMTCVDKDSSYEDILQVFRENMYTRLPVYDGTMDRIVGILNIKDLLLVGDRQRHKFTAQDIMREPFYTYEFQEVSDLMNELRKTSNNLAIILDEYGSTVGMVTLEDILEELVGEIRDEYDADEVDEITKISDTEYVLTGTAKLDDLEELLPLPERDPEHEDDYDSISGLIIHYLERLPVQGDTVTLPGMELAVTECDNNRIERVHVQLVEEEPETFEEEVKAASEA